MGAIEELKIMHPDAILTILVARQLKTKTHSINRLFIKHGIVVRKIKLETTRLMGSLHLKKKETFCYLYLCDLDLLSLLMRNLDEPIYNQNTISFILKLQKVIHTLKNKNIIYSVTEPKLQNLIDCKTLAAHLGISRRSVHKNKNYPKIIIDGKTYFDFNKVSAIVSVREKKATLKYQARELLHRLKESGLSNKAIFEYFDFKTKNSITKYMNQVMVQHQIGVDNAKKVVLKKDNIHTILKKEIKSA
jgi:hypothetical protein